MFCPHKSSNKGNKITATAAFTNYSHQLGEKRYSKEVFSFYVSLNKILSIRDFAISLPFPDRLLNL